MRHYKSEFTFQKYKPYESPWKRFWRSRQKRKYAKFRPIKEERTYRGNPFKIREKKIPTLGFKIMLLFILLITWAILLLYLPFFRINKISISGLNNLTRGDIEQFVNDNYFKPNKLLPYSNYFWVNPEKIKSGLNEKFALESVDVTKTFPNQLTINLVEKISSIIYDNGKKYYLLDSGGTVIKYLADVNSSEFAAASSPVTSTNKSTTSTIGFIATALTTATSSSSTTTSSLEHIPDYKKIQKLFGNYPILYDRRNLEVEVKQIGVLTENFVSSVLGWNKGLSQQGIEPKYFILDNLNSGVTIDTTNSWNILYRPEDNPTAQINNLKGLLKSIHPVNYVDLRFGDRVYWK